MKKEEDVNKSLPATLTIHSTVPKQRVTGSKVNAHEIDKVRGRVLDVVKENLPNVRGVLSGKAKWSNQQVKLFQIMLNKVLPDLSASMNEHIHKNRTIDQLTREELEEIVARGKKADKEEPLDVIDAEFTEDEGEMTPEEAMRRFQSIEKPNG